MKRPEPVNHLLEDLRAEAFRSAVGIQPQSKAIVYMADDRTGVNFDADECQLIFHSQDTVERFMDSFELDLGEASLELHDLNIDPELMDLLESIFGTVEEL